MSEALEAWARRVLLNAVAGLPPLRLRHSAGVAHRAAATGAALLPPDDAEFVRAAAWLHDIGYARGVVDTGCHPIDGARHLRQLGAPDDLVGLVAHHSEAVSEARERGLSREFGEFPEPPRELLDVLTYADMTTDEKGHQTDTESRLGGIFKRYGADDPVHVSVAAARTLLMAAVRRVEDRLRGQEQAC